MSEQRLEFPSARNDRQQIGDSPPDQREQGERDRDRILYTSALRRLAGITQVVAPTERFVLHNRLTHTFEVAQMGRRLTQKVLKDVGPTIASELGGLDPEVVEAAALAHDLGHPPFGHVAEQELDEMVTKAGYGDGFNGNAQSFRIVSKLSVRRDNIVGLNLTSATLNAILKYPWMRQASGEQHRKWGCYSTEKGEFDWAQQRATHLESGRTAEAEITDWADDVAYAVHDAEDFYRAGLIPLDRLAKDEEELNRFFDVELNRIRDRAPHSETDLRSSFTNLIRMLPVTEPYRGSRQQRADIRRATALLIAQYIHAFAFERSPDSRWRAAVAPKASMEVTMLKRLTWHYVIHNPSLATQQFGHRAIIRNLFEIYRAEIGEHGDERIFPVAYQDLLETASSDEERIRVVVDLIASMTEQQATEIHARLTGISFGSALEPFVA